MHRNSSKQLIRWKWNKN